MAAVAAHVAGLGPPVLMRASILCFFTLGILARRGGWERRAIALPLATAVLPFALLISVQLYVMVGLAELPSLPLRNAIDLAVRVAAALAFWRLAWALAGSGVRGVLLRIEPFAFFLFCAHLILIWLFGPLLGQMFGPLGSPLYPVYLVIQPLLVLGAVMLLATLLRRIAPGAATMLSGGRIRPVRGQ